MGAMSRCQKVRQMGGQKLHYRLFRAAHSLLFMSLETDVERMRRMGRLIILSLIIVAIGIAACVKAFAMVECEDMAGEVGAAALAPVPKHELKNIAGVLKPRSMPKPHFTPDELALMDAVPYSVPVGEFDPQQPYNESLDWDFGVIDPVLQNIQQSTDVLGDGVGDLNPEILGISY